MKIKLIALIFVLLSSSACKKNAKSDHSIDETTIESDASPNSLKGTWELTGFYNYQDNVVVDSFSNNTLEKQIKMYSDTKVMWCKLKPKDSIEFFGYGSYTYGDGTLIEVLEFGSHFMNEVIAEKKEFKFHLELTENTFEQIELDEDGNRIYSENYKRIE